MSSDDAERKDAVKKGNAIFAFTLKNKEQQSESWYIDLKEQGVVGKGTGPEGKKTDGVSYLFVAGGEPVQFISITKMTGSLVLYRFEYCGP